MKLFDVYADPKNLGKVGGLTVDGERVDLDLKVEDELVHGKFQIEREKTTYYIEFIIEELSFEGEWNRQWLTCLMKEVPRVSVKGSFLQELGSGIANALGRFVTMESVYLIVKDHVKGLNVIGNDVCLDLKKPPQGDWQRMILQFLLSIGFSFSVIPTQSDLLIEIHYNWPGSKT